VVTECSDTRLTSEIAVYVGTMSICFEHNKLLKSNVYRIQARMAPSSDLNVCH
jgi:hypothetical protein